MVSALLELGLPQAHLPRAPEPCFTTDETAWPASCDVQHEPHCKSGALAKTCVCKAFAEIGTALGNISTR